MDIESCSSSKDEDRMSSDYLAQLLKDKKQIQPFGQAFMHLERILDEEISRVRQNLLHASCSAGEPLSLPEPVGPPTILTEKIYVPVKDYPDFNFVGRILGPRGMTTKQLEQDLGCKIMIRGRGSVRDKKKEESYKGKANWEHLNDELHVLIAVEDSLNRANIRMKRAVQEVKKLLVPAPEGEDDLKKLQLMELAIMNGTYRESKPTSPTSPTRPLGMFPQAMFISPDLIHSPTGPTGSPIILSPRLPPFSPSSLPSPPVLVTSPSLMSPQSSDHPGIVYQFEQYFTVTPSGTPIGFAPVYNQGHPLSEHNLNHHQHQHHHHHHQQQQPHYQQQRYNGNGYIR